MRRVFRCLSLNKESGFLRAERLPYWRPLSVGVSTQLLYADALLASRLPQPPREVRRVYRLLAAGVPASPKAKGGTFGEASVHPTDPKKLRRSQEEEKALAVCSAPAESDCAQEEEAAFGEDLPFLNWHTELASAMLFSREGLLADETRREEERPPPQAADAPRSLKRVSNFLYPFLPLAQVSSQTPSPS